MANEMKLFGPVIFATHIWHTKVPTRLQGMVELRPTMPASGVNKNGPAIHPASERGSDGIGQVVLRLAICGHLEDEGELIRAGRHLAGKVGEADTCENDNLLAHRPVL